GINTVPALLLFAAPSMSHSNPRTKLLTCQLNPTWPPPMNTPLALAPLRIFSGVDAGLMNGVGHGGAITHQADCRRVLASSIAGSSVGRQRLQFRGRRALAREALERHHRLGAHARVVVVEQFAQVRHRDLDSG